MDNYDSGFFRVNVGLGILLDIKIWGKYNFGKHQRGQTRTK